MANLRSKALEMIQNRPPVAPVSHPNRVSEMFGENVFTQEVMKQYLTKDVYKALQAVIDHGSTSLRVSPTA